MVHLFRELSLGTSKRDSTPPPSPLTIPSPRITASDLQSPLGQLATQLTDSDLCLTAFDVLLAACRTSSAKPLSTAASPNSDSPNHNSSINHSPHTPALQRSLTSAAASKMKKALGLKSPNSSASGGEAEKPAMELPSPATVQTVEEIMEMYKSLPPRPSIEEVEAANSVIKTAEAEEQRKLEEISKQEALIDVPEELFFVLQEVKKNMVLFQSKEQRKEAL